jgi:hypothetical protein
LRLDLVRKNDYFFLQEVRPVAMQSIENNILKKISGLGKGWAFSPKDFSRLASREAVDLALHHLEKKGTIRRVLRGLYLFDSQAAGSAHPRSDIDARSTDHLQGLRDAPMLLEVAERV